MPDYDAGFKIAARESGREIAQLGDVFCDTWGPIAGEVHATERLADRAFRACRGAEEFIVYMEAYTRWETKAPWSVLAKSGLLSERERLPCVSLLYVLLPRAYQHQDGTFRLEVEQRPTQQIWFREICLWKLKPQPLWETSPGLMALYPLFQHAETPEKAVAWAAQAIRTHSTDIIRRADLLTVLAVFGKLATPGFDPINVIGRQAMKESPLYQEILEEGRVEARQADIVEVLSERFGKRAANTFRQALQTVDDAADLSELLHSAIRCRTLAAFRRLLEDRMKVVRRAMK